MNGRVAIFCNIFTICIDEKFIVVIDIVSQKKFLYMVDQYLKSTQDSNWINTYINDKPTQWIHLVCRKRVQNGFEIPDN